MKEIIKKVLAVVVGIPVGVVMFLVIAIFGTLMWPIYFIGKIIEYIKQKISKTEYNSETLNAMLEFIFVIYGFASLFILMPLSIIDPDAVE